MAEVKITQVDLNTEKVAINAVGNSRSVANKALAQAQDSHALFSKPDVYTLSSEKTKAESTVSKGREFIDISDKLAAWFGEKEKDVKDKLSDTFKRMFPKLYSATSAVDASMEQGDHQGQNTLIFDRQKKEKAEKENKAGEFLEADEKIYGNNKNLRIIIYKKFKKGKEQIIGILDKIESFLKPE